MLEVKNFMLNSLTVSMGLFIYTIFLYMGYLMFFGESSSTVKTKEEKEEEKVKEDIEKFDILEDVEI
jgi:hypothetical protein